MPEIRVLLGKKVVENETLSSRYSIVEGSYACYHDKSSEGFSLPSSVSTTTTTTTATTEIRPTSEAGLDRNMIRKTTISFSTCLNFSTRQESDQSRNDLYFFN